MRVPTAASHGVCNEAPDPLGLDQLGLAIGRAVSPMAEQWSFYMPSNGESRDVRHPKIVGNLENASSEEAEDCPPIVLEQDGGCRRYRLEDGKVCSSEDILLPAPAGPSGVASAFEQARSEFDELLSRAAKDLVGATPGLDAVERSVHDSSRSSGAEGAAGIP